MRQKEEFQKKRDYREENKPSSMLSRGQGLRPFDHCASARERELGAVTGRTARRRQRKLGEILEEGKRSVLQPFPRPV